MANTQLQLRAKKRKGYSQVPRSEGAAVARQTVQQVGPEVVKARGQNKGMEAEAGKRLVLWPSGVQLVDRRAEAKVGG